MGYTIVKRVRTSFIGGDGHATDGYRVHYVMEDGTPDYIEIEKNQYNAANVKAAIEADITTHLEIVSS